MLDFFLILCFIVCVVGIYCLLYVVLDHLKSSIELEVEHIVGIVAASTAKTQEDIQEIKELLKNTKPRQRKTKNVESSDSK